MTTTLRDELAALAEKATRIGWTADTFGNICRGMLPLFKKTGADEADTQLIVALRNNLPTILAALTEPGEAGELVERLESLRREMELRFTGSFAENAVNTCDAAATLIRQLLARIAVLTHQRNEVGAGYDAAQEQIASLTARVEGLREALLDLVADADKFDSVVDGDCGGYDEYVTIECRGDSIKALVEALGGQLNYGELAADALSRMVDESTACLALKGDENGTA